MLLFTSLLSHCRSGFCIIYNIYFYWQLCFSSVLLSNRIQNKHCNHLSYLLNSQSVTFLAGMSTQFMYGNYLYVGFGKTESVAKGLFVHLRDV